MPPAIPLQRQSSLSAHIKQKILSRGPALYMCAHMYECYTQYNLKRFPRNSDYLFLSSHKPRALSCSLLPQGILHRSCFWTSYSVAPNTLKPPMNLFNPLCIHIYLPSQLFTTSGSIFYTWLYIKKYFLCFKICAFFPSSSSHHSWF